MKVSAIVGGQWGDEGKGKLVDILSDSYDIVTRATGGANAGHTIYKENKKGEVEKFVFHLIPSGMFHPEKIGVMGNGMVIHLPSLFSEMQHLEKSGVKIKNRLLLSDRAHLVFDYHKLIDQMQEKLKGSKKIGTTARGIGPAYTDKVSRIGVRVGEFLDWDIFLLHYTDNLAMLQRMYDFPYNPNPEIKFLHSIRHAIIPLITDTTAFLHGASKAKKKILLEGANGTLLDLDHGTYPFVTSSNATVGGILVGSGMPPNVLKEVIGIFKAYVTRVGSGVFPTELTDQLGEQIREAGNEYGSTTGRPRRCGWFDAVAARYAVTLNGMTSINLTKLDVLNFLPKIKIGVAYRYKGKKLTEMPSSVEVLENVKIEYKELPGWQEDISGCRTFHSLPKNCQRYVKILEELLGCKIKYIGVGKTRDEMIFR